MSAPPKINPIIPELIKAHRKYRLLSRNGNTRKNTVGTAVKMEIHFLEKKIKIFFCLRRSMLSIQ